MKTLLLVFGLTLGLFSCQSEFDKQINNAKQLVNKELQLKYQLLNNPVHEESMMNALKEVREDLAFHAHMSGNKQLFLETLHNYRTQRIQSLEQPELLITKFP